MPTIDQLSQMSSLDDTDELPVFSRANGSTRKATVLQVAGHVLKTIQNIPAETGYSATSTGAFSVTVIPPTPGGNTWAQISLSGPAPAGTLVLPDPEYRAHGQDVLVTCTQAVAALTINGNGAATVGAPVAISPTTPFTLHFDSISNTWYRVG